MSGVAKPHDSFDAVLLDDRNERPLMIALTTIVAVWSIAFALTVGWADLRVGSTHAPERPAAMSVMER